MSDQHPSPGQVRRMNILVRDEEARIYRAPSVHPDAHAHPLQDGEYLFVGWPDASLAIVGDAQLLDHVLSEMVRRGIPHTKLKNMGDHYLYEPWGLKIVEDEERSHPQNGRMFESDDSVFGAALKIGRLKHFRATLKLLQEASHV